MMATTNAGTKVKSLSYAWASISPGGHWRRRTVTEEEPFPGATWQSGDQTDGPQGFLARLQPFQSGSMSAAWHGQTYVVRSYRTPIVKVHAEPGKCGQVEVNDTAYSVATSHHQEIATAWAGHAVEWVEHHPSSAG